MAEQETHQAGLGARVKLERINRGWSLRRLAAEAGVSKAMISRVERGESSPTATVLGRLSGALEVSMSALLTTSVRGATWTDPESGYRRRAVATTADFPVDVTEVVMPRGARQAFPASAYAFNQHVIWVADGALSFTEGGTTHVLGAGDSLQLGEPADCVFANETDVSCRYIVILAPGDRRRP